MVSGFFLPSCLWTLVQRRACVGLRKGRQGGGGGEGRGGGRMNERTRRPAGRPSVSRRDGPTCRAGAGGRGSPLLALAPPPLPSSSSRDRVREREKRLASVVELLPFSHSLCLLDASRRRGGERSLAPVQTRDLRFALALSLLGPSSSPRSIDPTDVRVLARSS